MRAESQSPIVVETLDSVNASALFVMETTQEQILEEESDTPTSGSELHYQMQILQEEVMALRGLVEQLSYQHKGIEVFKTTAIWSWIDVYRI